METERKRPTQNLAHEAVKNYREQLAPNLEADYLKASRAQLISTKLQRSKQHDEWAMLNYYTKVSKYDLDRKSINMERAKHEKQLRRVANAKAKKDLIESEAKQENYA